MSKKLLFCFENYYPYVGGAEILYKNILEGLVKKGYDITLVTHHIKGTKNYEELNGVKIHRIKCFENRFLFPIFASRKMWILSKEISSITTSTYTAMPLASLIGLFRKKQTIAIIHELWTNNWSKYTDLSVIKKIFFSIFERIIYMFKVDTYIPVSDSTKKQLLSYGIKKNKIHRIYNGMDYSHWDSKKYSIVDVRKELNLKKNSFKAIFYGRPGTSKGLSYLINAVPYIIKKIPNFKLIAIVSNGPEHKNDFDRIDNLIKELDIQDNVILKPSVSYKKLPEYVKYSNIVIVPSLAEGFGFSAYEACLMGKPLVVSKTTSLPEVVFGKVNFSIPKNSKSIASAVIKSYKKDYTKIPRKDFTVETMIRNYGEFYSKKK